MEMYLQFAHGMKQMSIDLANDWKGATVILSPRDITPSQLEKWNPSFKKAGIKMLFDPQCYYPKCDHPKLVQYDYWDSSFSTNLESMENYEEGLIKKILKYNDIVGTTQFIIPSVMRAYNESWFERWISDSEQIISAAKKIVTDRELILTLTLPEDLMSQKEDEIEKLIEITEKFDVDGFYIIAKSPGDMYLVDKPLWLSNILNLCAGLKLQNKKVIYGYGNHQMLSLSVTGIDAMATGTFLNVRRFTNKFEDTDNVKRKSTWYYYPPSLSEYKIPFLDVAFNNGVLNQMKPTKEMDLEYVDLLFSGVLPSSTNFTETLAFKHYLNCVKIQMKDLVKKSYKETFATNELLLESSRKRIESLENNGVYAQGRSFEDVIDVNKSALQRLDKNRGLQLQLDWKNIK